MSYGLYASTNVTLKQIKTIIEQDHPEYIGHVLDSKEYGFKTGDGQVTFGFTYNDTDIINTMDISGDGEKHVRLLILKIDPNAEIYDEDEMFDECDNGKFKNDAIHFDYLPGS